MSLPAPLLPPLLLLLVGALVRPAGGAPAVHGTFTGPIDGGASGGGWDLTLVMGGATGTWSSQVLGCVGRQTIVLLTESTLELRNEELSDPRNTCIDSGFTVLRLLSGSSWQYQFHRSSGRATNNNRGVVTFACSRQCGHNQHCSSAVVRSPSTGSLEVGGCACDAGTFGPDCTSCPGRDATGQACFGHGTCSSFGTCRCSPGFSATTDCQCGAAAPFLSNGACVPRCPNLSLRGVCVDQCPRGWMVHPTEASFCTPVDFCREPTSDCYPGVSTIGNGFSTRDGAARHPVLVQQFSERAPATFDGRAIPTNVLVAKVPASRRQESLTLLQTREDSARISSLRLSGATLGAIIGTSVTAVLEAVRISYRETSVVEEVVRLATISINNLGPLHQDFVDAVNQTEAQDAVAVAALLATYGTYVIGSETLGGRRTSTFSRDTCFASRQQFLEESASVAANHFGADSSELEETISTKLAERVATDVRVEGGTQASSIGFNQWLASLDASPAVIARTLVPITAFVQRVRPDLVPAIAATIVRLESDALGLLRPVDGPGGEAGGCPVEGEADADGGDADQTAKISAPLAVGIVVVGGLGLMAWSKQRTSSVYAT